MDTQEACIVGYIVDIDLSTTLWTFGMSAIIIRVIGQPNEAISTDLTECQ